MTNKDLDPVFDHFYVARQPIFSDRNRIWGYELLFRAGPDTKNAEISDQDLATLSVASCGFIRSQELTDQSKKICINFTGKLILQGAPRGLPPTVTVIEVLEDIVPTDELVHTLIELKQEGYLVAIDDYEGKGLQKEFLDLADIVKVDILGKDLDQIQTIFASLEGNRSIKLAEKIDNEEIITHLEKLGCELYQGYFFARPETLEGRSLRSTEVSKFRILQALSNPSFPPQEMAEIIEADPSITYRLLRLLNTPAFGFSIKITSIRHAILLLGSKRLGYWLRMVVTSDLMGKNKTPELYRMALTRGRILEELCKDGQIQVASSETMFLFGMLSLIESMLGVPLANILEELPLSEDLKAGYLDEDSTYAKHLELVSAIENVDAARIESLCQKLNIDTGMVADASVRSMAWATSLFNQIL
jgi:EAL and modified HD-GYP domain-containing signal transduction protein